MADQENKIKVLQLANGYLDKALYASLFDHMDPEKADNLVFVPLKSGDKRTPDHPGVQALACFNEIDRRLFYPKQYKTFSAVKRLYGDQLKDIRLSHAHTLFSTGYTAMLLKRKYGIPYITAVRNTDVNRFFAKHPYFRRVGTKILTEAERVIFLSSGYADQVIDNYVDPACREEIRKKSEVITNGIDDFFFDQTPPARKGPEGTLRIIHIGDINKNKNVLTTLKAVELLREKGRDVTFTLVGEVKSDDIAEQLRGRAYVELNPKCPHREVLDYYARTDILCVPSRHETFGLVYAEAMSQGLPVIYTRGQGFDGIFPDGEVGYAVDPDSAAEIAGRMEDIAGRYAEMSASCIAGSRRFLWQEISSRYTGIYQGICKA